MVSVRFQISEDITGEERIVMISLILYILEGRCMKVIKLLISIAMVSMELILSPETTTKKNFVVIQIVWE